LYTFSIPNLLTGRNGATGAFRTDSESQTFYFPVVVFKGLKAETAMTGMISPLGHWLFHIGFRWLWNSRKQG